MKIVDFLAQPQLIVNSLKIVKVSHNLFRLEMKKLNQTIKKYVKNRQKNNIDLLSKVIQYAHKVRTNLRK